MSTVRREVAIDDADARKRMEAMRALLTKADETIRRSAEARAAEGGAGAWGRLAGGTLALAAQQEAKAAADGRVECEAGATAMDEEVD